MIHQKNINDRDKRHLKIRAKISGNQDRPRLYVFRSSAHIYGALVDDLKGHTLVAASDLEIKKGKKKETQKTKTELAKEVGLLLAKRANEKKIDTVVFDRAGYLYHGRVKALAEGARTGGLKF
ncbi:MAG: 50S ribosomal protein L18 [Patescibacteria group bacterium]|nr:50S ribosomal protein L18 [Patescibacteria group bacterium]